MFFFQVTIGGLEGKFLISLWFINYPETVFMSPQKMETKMHFIMSNVKLFCFCFEGFPKYSVECKLKWVPSVDMVISDLVYYTPSLS